MINVFKKNSYKKSLWSIIIKCGHRDVYEMTGGHLEIMFGFFDLFFDLGNPNFLWSIWIRNNKTKKEEEVSKIHYPTFRKLDSSDPMDFMMMLESKPSEIPRFYHIKTRREILLEERDFLKKRIENWLLKKEDIIEIDKLYYIDTFFAILKEIFEDSFRKITTRY